MMNNIVHIRDYLQICCNCRWHTLHADGEPTCIRPGGWHYDYKFEHCATFERREGGPYDPTGRQGQAPGQHL